MAAPPRKSARAIKSEWACGSCGVQGNDDSVLCECCRVWHHAKCERLPANNLGNVSLASELRVCTCIEMVSEKRVHVKKHAHTRIGYVSPDYEDAMWNYAIDGQYSCAWSMSAAASVIGTNVVLVYPILNTTFIPAKSKSNVPVVIMWSSASQTSSGIWIPNHFVLLLLSERPSRLVLSNMC